MTILFMFYLFIFIILVYYSESLYTLGNSYVELCKLNLDDVLKSLSAVISYQHTCYDELMRTNNS